MMLEGYYYHVNECHIDARSCRFRVELLSDCDVYRGHFPGHPISPGVFNIRLVKECAMRFFGVPNLYFSHIKQCRFTNLVSPERSPMIDILLEVEPTEGGHVVKATLSDEKQTYMKLKGELKRRTDHSFNS